MKHFTTHPRRLTEIDSQVRATNSITINRYESALDDSQDVRGDRDE